MIPEVDKELGMEVQSEFHKKMLKHCLDRIKLSRDHMSRFYSDWDLYDDVYQGKRTVPIDKQDIKARERKEPEKMVIPLTYAQVQVFIAFLFQLFGQRPNFYEMSGSGAEDWKAAKIAESLLQRDLNHNKFVVVLYQFLLNVGRFGVGILKHSWTKEMQKQWTKKTEPAMPSLSGVPMFPKESMVLEDLVKFLGNEIRIISPYRFFPDVNVPLNDFQSGEYCASEIDVTHIWLRRMEQSGMFAGTKWIKEIPSDGWERRNSQGLRSRCRYDMMEGKQKGGVILTEVQIDLIPNEFEIDGGKKLGTEDYPLKYVCCVANDSRIIKCEPMNYLHNNYTYSVAQMSPDEHREMNAGVAELVNELQASVTWLFNSRILNVRQTLQNRWIVDPEGVEMSDLAERKSIVRLKKGMARSGVERWIQQLPINDVTSGHIQDAETLGQVIQVVTGINENALGQYSKGRRSAEQTKAVNSGAASRLKMIGSLLWAQGFEPLGRDLLSNLRDGLDVEQLVRVIGLQAVQPTSPYSVNQRDMAQFLPVSKKDLVGNYDFEALDGTLPSEKGVTSAMLQELLVGILTNPQAAAILGLDARALMTEIAELNDIRNPERFFLQPTQQQAMLGIAAQANNPQTQQMIAAPAVSAGVTSQTAQLPQGPMDLAALVGGPVQLPALPLTV